MTDNDPPLTPRQRQVLTFVREHQAAHGVAPSTREIQARFGFASQTAAVDHLRALERKGALRRLARKARAILAPEPQAPPTAFAQIPLYGTIPAGFPVAAEQERESVISVDLAALRVSPHTPVFAVRVRGDSMIAASILDGDIVFVTPGTPRNGQIVAALIDGESTLKRFVTHRGRAFLRAENPRYPDLLPAESLVIQGLMVGLLRTTPTTRDG
jgi:repressor LexA